MRVAFALRVMQESGHPDGDSEEYRQNASWCGRFADREELIEDRPVPARQHRACHRHDAAGGRHHVLDVAPNVPRHRRCYTIHSTRSLWRSLMNPILSTGIMIGVLCTVWTLVMGYSGLYKDPSLASLFFLVIP